MRRRAERAARVVAREGEGVSRRHACKEKEAGGAAAAGERRRQRKGVGSGNWAASLPSIKENEGEEE